MCNCCGAVEMKVTLKQFYRGTKQERSTFCYLFSSPAWPASSPPAEGHFRV